MKKNNEEKQYELLMGKIKDIPWLVDYADRLSSDRIIRLLEVFGTNFEINMNKNVCNFVLKKDEKDKEKVNYYLANVHPGIYIVGGNINGLSKLNLIDSNFKERKTSVIHYCIKGRCEILTNDGKYAFMEPGILCVESQKHKEKNYNFFDEDYEGIEIAFELDKFDELDEKEKYMIKSLGIDMDILLDKYNKNIDYKIGKVSDNLKSNYEYLRHLLMGKDTDNTSLLISVLSICDHIRTGHVNTDSDRHYLTKGQRKIVKEIQGYIVKNVDKDITATELSEKWNLNLISLNKYFQIMYGETVHKYIQKYRMKEAAGLLISSDDKISSIAGKVGYENQSKFGNVFKKIYELTPVEYRRLYKKVNERN